MQNNRRVLTNRIIHKQHSNSTTPVTIKQHSNSTTPVAIKQQSNSTTPVAIKQPSNLSWFPEFSAAFAISIRMPRWQSMRARLDKWATHVERWPGTDGSYIDKEDWIKKGILAPESKLRRGEIGCYDSHIKIWETIVTRKLSMTLIMEDDANMEYTRVCYNKIRAGLDEAKKFQWDLLYIGRCKPDSNHKQLSSTMMRPKGYNCLFAYVLTLEGAKKLLSRARPYTIPVDVFVANMHDSNIIDAIAVHPTVFHVVPARSDTVCIT